MPNYFENPEITTHDIEQLSSEDLDNKLKEERAEEGVNGKIVYTGLYIAFSTLDAATLITLVQKISSETFKSLLSKGANIRCQQSRYAVCLEVFFRRKLSPDDYLCVCNAMSNKIGESDFGDILTNRFSGRVLAVESATEHLSTEAFTHLLNKISPEQLGWAVSPNAHFSRLLFYRTSTFPNFDILVNYFCLRCPDEFSQSIGRLMFCSSNSGSKGKCEEILKKTYDVIKKLLTKGSKEKLEDNYHYFSMLRQLENVKNNIPKWEAYLFERIKYLLENGHFVAMCDYFLLFTNYGEPTTNEHYGNACQLISNTLSKYFKQGKYKELIQGCFILAKHDKYKSVARDYIGKGYKNLGGYPNGVIFTDTFSLRRGAKPNKQSKICLISDGQGLYRDAYPNVGLHHRQSLAERLIAARTDNVTQIQEEPYATYNQLVVNIGFVLTDRPHEKDGMHRRIFRTMALSIDNSTRYYGEKGHTEPALYSHLKETNDREEAINLIALIRQFKLRYHIKEPGHKVYDMVIDLHSTNDMCVECYEETQTFLRRFRPLLFTTLENEGFVLPKNKSTELPIIIDRSTNIGDRNFHIVIRFSSNYDYDTCYSAQYPKQTSIKNYENRGKGEISRTIECSTEHDLRLSHSSLLFHGSSEKWHGFWNQSDHQLKGEQEELQLDNWSAFRSWRGESRPKSKCFNYTHLGFVQLWHSTLEEPKNAGQDEDNLDGLSENLQQQATIG